MLNPPRRAGGSMIIAAMCALFAASAAGAQGAPTPPADAATATQAPPKPKTPLPSRDTPRAPQPGQKQASQDPDWPCVQPKVAELSYGQMWSGPPLDDALTKWKDDDDVSDLVPKLAARRTSIDDAKTAIVDFASKAGDRKSEKLTLLFAGVFNELNGQRSHVISGIQRYAQKQRALANKIRDESIKIANDQKDMASQMTPEAQEQQQAIDWDTRVYDDRQQSLTYVCESPVILEQRAFDLGREIQSLLGSG